MRVALCLAVLMALQMLVAGQQATSPAIREFDVIVSDDRGRPVPQVTAADLVLHLDGRPHAVDRVTADPMPMSLVVVVDMSRSMTNMTDRPTDRLTDLWGLQVLALFEGIERDLPRRLGPGDRARLARFVGASLGFSERLTSERDELTQAARRVLSLADVPMEDRLGGSPALDAVVTAAATLRGEPGRRAVLLFTDGESSGNHRGLEEAARELVDLRVPVHVMMEADNGEPARRASHFTRYPPNHVLDKIVRRLADWTGGVYMDDDRLTRPAVGFATPAPPFDRLFALIHGTYRVALSGADARTGATIELTARNPAHRVRTPRWITAR